MPDYECPNCGGGFPENPDRQCPWCHTAIDGAYGSTPIGTIPTNTTNGRKIEVPDDGATSPHPGNQFESDFL